MKNLLISFFAAFGLAVACTGQDKVKVVAPKEFSDMAMKDSAAVVIDVRTAEEYAEGHVPGASNIDFLQEDSFAEAISQLDKDKHYYIYCRSGRRSHEAAVKMQAAGLHVVDMKGGWLAWTAGNLPCSSAK